MEKKQFNFKNISGMLSSEEMNMVKGGYSHPIEGCIEDGKACDGGSTVRCCNTFLIVTDSGPNNGKEICSK